MIPASGTPVGYLADVALVGLVSGLSSLANKRVAAALGIGGMLDVGLRAAKQYVIPMIPGMSGFGCMDGSCGMGSFDDYLTPADVAAARPLGYFGDYLTPADVAAARPLGQVDDDIGEELASL
jgi:hypothetical protein